jgi:hypothetical protein
MARPTFVSKLLEVEHLPIDKSAVRLAEAVIEYFGTGHIPKILDGDRALRSAAYFILAKAGMPRPRRRKGQRQAG